MNHLTISTAQIIIYTIGIVCLWAIRWQRQRVLDERSSVHISILLRPNLIAYSLLILLEASMLIMDNRWLQTSFGLLAFLTLAINLKAQTKIPIDGRWWQRKLRLSALLIVSVAAYVTVFTYFAPAQMPILAAFILYLFESVLHNRETAHSLNAIQDLRLQNATLAARLHNHSLTAATQVRSDFKQKAS